MNNNTTHTIEERLEQASQEVSLSVSEKVNMRQALEARMHTAEASVWQGIYRSAVLRYAVAPLLIFFMIGGGVTYASTDALPNDALYAVKTHVYEPLVGLTKGDVESRIAYKQSLAEKRLHELVTLLEQGELDAESQEKTLRLFDTHEEDIRDDVSDAAPALAVSAQSDLEGVVQAHAQVASRVGNEELTSDLNTRAALLTERRLWAEAGLQQSPDSLASASAQASQEAQDAIEIVREVFAEQDVSSSLALQARLRVDVAEQTWREGQELAETGAFAEAVSRYQRAKRQAREAQITFGITERLALHTPTISDERVATLERAERTSYSAPVEDTSATMAMQSAAFVAEEGVVPEVSPITPYDYFRERVSERVPSGQVESLMQVYPGLVSRDFAGVEAEGGVYQVANGNVTFTAFGTTPNAALSSEGYRRLVLNVATRLGIEITSQESIDIILEYISITLPSNPAEQVEEPERADDGGSEQDDRPLERNDVEVLPIEIDTELP